MASTQATSQLADGKTDSVSAPKGADLGSALASLVRLTADIPQHGISASLRNFFESLHQSVKENPIASARSAFQLGMGLSTLTRSQVADGGSQLVKGIVSKVKNERTEEDGKEEEYETKH